MVENFDQTIHFNTIMKFYSLLITILLLPITVFGQSIQLIGYTFDAELNNRLDDTQIKIYHKESLITSIQSDRNGAFQVQLPDYGRYELELSRPAYQKQTVQIDIENKEQYQIGLAMNRINGYEFVGSIKHFFDNQSFLGDDVTDTRVEIYNHITDIQELDVRLGDRTTFDFNLEQGNRYTVMVRKQDYFTKRFDIIVGIDGCVVCFEGLGTEYLPSSMDDLLGGNTKGVILANIPIRPISINKAIRLNNIYYDYDKWNIRSDARPSLIKLVQVMRETPNIVIELGSHTDNRGKENYNMDLSQKRAQAAVDYIVSKGIEGNRIVAQGYGESQPINHCVDGVQCKEKEYQQNRRTEFKVTQILSTMAPKTLKEILAIERVAKKREKVNY